MTTRELTKRFNGLKRYITNLRRCVFSDYLNGTGGSIESEVFDQIQLLLDGKYKYLKKPIFERKSNIKFDRTQINDFFREVLLIEEAVYGEPSELHTVYKASHHIPYSEFSLGD